MEVRRVLIDGWMVLVLTLVIQMMIVKGRDDNMVVMEGDGTELEKNASCKAAMEKGDVLQHGPGSWCEQKQKKNATSEDYLSEMRDYGYVDSGGREYNQEAAPVHRRQRPALGLDYKPRWRTFRLPKGARPRKDANNNNHTRTSSIDGAAWPSNVPIWDQPVDLTMDVAQDWPYVTMQVGTPPVSHRFYVDVFTRMSHIPCTVPGAMEPEPGLPPYLTLFDIAASSSYRPYPCNIVCNRFGPETRGCIQQYNQCGFQTRRMPVAGIQTGLMAKDRFRLSRNSNSIQLLFGCTLPPRIQRPLTILGIGKGPTSFSGQLENTDVFWCLPPEGIANGVFGFGRPAMIVPESIIPIPMSNVIAVENGLTLTDVLIDGVSVQGWQNFGGNNGPTMYFDLGSTYTQFPSFMFHGLLQDFQQAARLRGFRPNFQAGPACYDLPRDSHLHPGLNLFPRITFNFLGTTTGLTFTNTKVLNPSIAAAPALAANLRSYCLPIRPAAQVFQMAVYLGQIQMEGLLVEIDNEARTISVTPDYCTAAAFDPNDEDH